VLSGLIDLVPRPSVRRHGHVAGRLVAVPSPSWLIAAGGVFFGLWAWHYARKRGLQHLGAAELNSRWTNVRDVSKWGW
jgi:hypothetical protein